MDKFINQPAEDRETNQLCINYHMLQYDIVNIRTRMEERYEYDLEYQKRWLDDHIKKNGKPIAVIDDDPYYFHRNFYLQTDLLRMKKELEEAELKLEQLQTQLGGRSWVYTVEYDKAIQVRQSLIPVPDC